MYFVVSNIFFFLFFPSVLLSDDTFTFSSSFSIEKSSLCKEIQFWLIELLKPQNQKQRKSWLQRWPGYFVPYVDFINYVRYTEIFPNNNIKDYLYFYPGWQPLRETWWTQCQDGLCLGHTEKQLPEVDWLSEVRHLILKCWTEQQQNPLTTAFLSLSSELGIAW